MPNPYFRFKQFVVYQDRCGMKVGTDGVLLGAWAPCSNAHRILDIGTGTGLIALMLAQRCTAHIQAVEIDQEAARQAEENIRKSPWAEKINVHAQPFQQFAQTAGAFDLIVSNPPYFQNSLKAPVAGRSVARHTDTLSFLELIEGSKKLLAPQGKLSVILPTTEGEQFILTAGEVGLYCQQKTTIIPRPQAAPKRLLLTFGAEATPCTSSEILIETGIRHSYSEQFKALTHDFYLDK